MKQRLVGAAVLVALAVIFLPMLVKGPAPDSGVSDLPLDMPDAPGGEYVTRDLPLVTPGAAAPTALGGDRLPMVDTGVEGGIGTGAPTPADTQREAAAAVAAAAEPAPTTAPEMFPAATAGGDYAVSFGTYASRANAVAMVGDLRASQLPGYSEAGRVDGKDVWRVRIGPYATRADAEAARLRAMHVRDDLDARVVVLDAGTAPAAATPATTAPAPAAPKPQVAPAPAAASAVGFAVQVGAFSRTADAVALRDRLRGAGFNAFTESVETDKGALTRVKAGPVLSRADADQLKAQLESKLGLDGIVRSHP